MEIIAKILGVIGYIIIVVLLTSLPVMWLWNWLIPEIFGLTTLDFWQALGLSLLCNLLFKGSK